MPKTRKKSTKTKGRGETWRKNLSKGRIRSSLISSPLRNKRLEIGLKQTDAAKKASVSPTYFAQFERGDRPLKAPMAKRIADCVGLKLTQKKFFEKNKDGLYIAKVSR